LTVGIRSVKPASVKLSATSSEDLLIMKDPQTHDRKARRIACS